MKEPGRHHKRLKSGKEGKRRGVSERRLNCVKYMMENGIKWRKQHMEVQQGGGDLECLKYARVV